MTKIKTLVCDIGSGSVRVAILEYSSSGILEPIPLAHSTKPIEIYNQQTDYYEQSTDDIWKAFTDCCRECLAASSLDTIDSIAFSATCSLVIVEKNRSEKDVIMWMDHRAKEQANRITESGHEVLQQFGGTCSPEFSLSKLIWLNENRPERFRNAEAFMELPDWMSYRCSLEYGHSERFSRSVCSVVCKWGFDAEKSQWPKDLFEKLGFSDDVQLKFGTKFDSPGKAISFLREEASIELGLKTFNPQTTIASPLIDAHAGMLSMLIFGDNSGDWENVLGLISGTSACHMLLNQERIFSNGIWGPYKHAIIPDFYLREAGQSATGKLIDDIISNYYDKPPDKKELVRIIKNLNEQLRLKNNLYKSPLVINPSFHGNRSPIGNSHLKGAVYGMTLEKTKLLDLYVGTIEALAYETKFILDTAQSRDQLKDKIRKVIVTGGLVKNDYYMQIHSDVLDCSLMTFSAGDADLMLVGASIIAFTAAKTCSTNERIKEQFIKLSQKNTEQFRNNFYYYKPRKEHSVYHTKKYASYRTFLDCCTELCRQSFCN